MKVSILYLSFQNPRSGCKRLEFRILERFNQRLERSDGLHLQKPNRHHPSDHGFARSFIGAGIDFGDLVNRVGFQISSDPSTQMINDKKKPQSSFFVMQIQILHEKRSGTSENVDGRPFRASTLAFNRRILLRYSFRQLHYPLLYIQVQQKGERRSYRYQRSLLLHIFYILYPG